MRLRRAFARQLQPFADATISDWDEEVETGDYRREVEEFLTQPLPLQGFLMAIWMMLDPQYAFEPRKSAPSARIG